MDSKQIEAGEMVEAADSLVAVPSHHGDDDAPLITDGALALKADVQTDASEEEKVTREQRRTRRKREVRARTISVKRMTKRELELGRLLYPDVAVEKPATRADG